MTPQLTPRGKNSPEIGPSGTTIPRLVSSSVMRKVGVEPTPGFPEGILRAFPAVVRQRLTDARLASTAAKYGEMPNAAVVRCIPAVIPQSGRPRGDVFSSVNGVRRSNTDITNRNAAVTALGLV